MGMLTSKSYWVFCKCPISAIILELSFQYLCWWLDWAIRLMHSPRIGSNRSSLIKLRPKLRSQLLNPGNQLKQFWRIFDSNYLHQLNLASWWFDLRPSQGRRYHQSSRQLKSVSQWMSIALPKVPKLLQPQIDPIPEVISHQGSIDGWIRDGWCLGRGRGGDACVDIHHPLFTVHWFTIVKAHWFFHTLLEAHFDRIID